MTILSISTDAIRLALGLVFFVSSLGKWRDPRGFVTGVTNFQVLPRSMALGYGALLLPGETLVAASLLTDRFVHIAAPIALLLLVSFFIAVAVAVGASRVVPCHCFGASQTDQVSQRSLARIGLLIAAAVVTIGAQQLGVDDRADRSSKGIYFDSLPLDILMMLSLSAFVLVFGMWLLTIPEVIRPWRRVLTRQN